MTRSWWAGATTFLAAGSVLAASVAYATAGCPRAPLGATFLQPTAAIRARESRWDELFDDVRRLGMSEIYLQWSAGVGVMEEGEARWPEDPAPFVRSVLDRAARRGLRVWVGLTYTDAWWTRIDRTRPLESVEVYLRRRLFWNGSLATLVAPVVRDHAAFAGWYVNDEIDDENWLEEERRVAVARYVHDLTARLRALTPDRSVSISGFATGFAPPGLLAEQWRAIVAGGGPDVVLLQDGIGAGHLTDRELRIVVPPVRAAVEEAGSDLGMVVELFAQTPGTGTTERPFSAAPARLDRVKAQTVTAASLVGGPLVASSVPDYMGPLAGGAAADLYRGVLRWEEGCGLLGGGAPRP